ncbi:hypothetical protein F5B17DRAFT_422869 [Nemania serpens]|nr:hypothetical protein F5B17DRAFT_422869 [Nemania serpens]
MSPFFFVKKAEGDQAEARKSRPSIGVELEFLLCIAEANQPLNVPEMFEMSKGAPYVLPADVRRYKVVIEMVRETLGRTIANAVASHRGDRVVQSKDEASSDMESLHLKHYSDWTVHVDHTVVLPDHLRAQPDIRGYRWYPVEIASPVLWATDESWEEIHAVVRAIRDTYWLLTPPTAGLHYHYGNGKSYIPFGKLRRIAALLFAVDPIMTQLHPEHRRSNKYCLSNRLYSRIAHGRSAAAAARELGAEYVEEEPEVFGVRRRPDPAARPVRPRTSTLFLPFKRGTLTGYEFDASIFDAPAYADEVEEAEGRPGNPAPSKIPYAVGEILRCLNAPTVAELMRYKPIPGDRPAYSFQDYTLDRYKRMIEEDCLINLEYQSKRTIEFRQMASTMEPEEVVAHGKVIVRLCEFAAESDLEELWRLVFDCATAEDHSDWFDVFDLLAELGLDSEASVLQHSVARFRSESTPESKAAAKRTGHGSNCLRCLFGLEML